MRRRAELNDQRGYAAHAIRESRGHELLGFASVRHYCEERLIPSARCVEERARLEKRRWERPAGDSSSDRSCSMRTTPGTSTVA